MAKSMNACKGCGCQFDPSESSTGVKRGNSRKFCSLSCRHKAYRARYMKSHRCVVCGTEFLGKQRNVNTPKTCSDKCKSAWANRNAVYIACAGCGQQFRKQTNRHRYNKYCSRQCYFTKGASPPSVIGGIERARKSLREAVYKRDGNKCQDCGKRLRHDVSDRHPDKANIDHVIPRSKGGATVLQNLQALCRACNSKKSDKRLNLF